MKPLPHLFHLTVNTGDAVDQDPGDVSDDAISALVPLVKRGGPLPAPLGAFRVEIVRETIVPAAVFKVHRGPDLIMVCWLCWDIAVGEAIWGEVFDTYLKVTALLPEVPAESAAMPDSIPWLAVMLLPGITQQTQDNIAWLGDFERCMAFAILHEVERERNADYGCGPSGH